MPSKVWLDTLSSYTGGINDRKKKYFIAVESYPSSMTVDDMEMSKLGSLGYDGALPDRWKKYLESLGGSGSLDDMINSHISSSFYAGGGSGAQFGSAFSSAFQIS